MNRRQFLVLSSALALPRAHAQVGRARILRAAPARQFLVGDATRTSAWAYDGRCPGPSCAIAKQLLRIE